jgi:hypothetical protein
MKFIIKLDTIIILHGDLIYSLSENSFSYLEYPEIKDKDAIITIYNTIAPEYKDTDKCFYIGFGSLQIDVRLLNYNAISVWGYCTLNNQKKLIPPINFSKIGNLIINLDDKKASGEIIYSGISYTYSDINEFPILFDPSNGWVCIGNHSVNNHYNYVEFADNIIAVIENSSLIALWLHPRLIK